MKKKWFDFLNINSIDYCLLNGDVTNVMVNDSRSDVDILVKKNVFSKIEQHVKNFCLSNRYLLVQSYHHDLYAKNIFVFDPANFELLNLDFYGEIIHQGVPFFTEEKIFESIEVKNGVCFIDASMDFVHYFFKKLGKGKIEQEVFDKFRHSYSIHAAEIKKRLHEAPGDLGKAVELLFEREDLDGINRERPEILQRLRQQRKMSLLRHFGNIKRVFKRIVRPTGLTVCFLGPDGCGKSTIIKQIHDRNIPFRKTDYYHLKPKKNKSDGGVVTNPHSAKPYSSLISKLKLVYFIFLYNFYWLKNIKIQKIKSTLIFFDRYFDDLIVDPLRFRYKGSFTLINLASRFIPKPDIYFVLHGDLDVIYGRKQELSKDELKRQLAIYLEISKQENYELINIDSSVDDISNLVFDLMMRKLNERF